MIKTEIKLKSKNLNIKTTLWKVYGSWGWVKIDKVYSVIRATEINRLSGICNMEIGYQVSMYRSLNVC